MIIDERELDKKLEKAGKQNIKGLKQRLKRKVAADLRADRPTNLLRLCDATGLCPSDAASLYHLLYDQIEFAEDDKPKGEPSLMTYSIDNLVLEEGEAMRLSGRGFRLNFDPNYTFSWIMLSDTHLGSKHDCIEGLEEAYDCAVSIGAVAVTHAGDLTDGFFGRHRDMYKYLRPECMGHDGQLKWVVDKYPKREGLKTYFIAGNHDHFAMDTADVDICRHIARERDDLVYIKSDTITEALARKNVDPETLRKIIEAKELGSGRVGAVRLGPSHLPVSKRKLIHMMLHPGNGSAQTLSYKPQRIAANLHLLMDSYENMENDQGIRIKPHTMQIGHYHKADMNILRRVHIFQSGTMKKADQFHETKNLNNMMGYWVVEATTKSNGDIVRMRHHFQRPYVDPTGYTRTVIPMRK